MSDFHHLVPIPPLSDINSGLHAAEVSTMTQLFGRPGRLTRDCSAVTNAKLRAQIVHANVGPFSVDGWGPAVERLKLVFAEVKAANPALYAVVRSAGMLCCRAVRNSQSNFSNHSWGCAIDLEIESELDALGEDHVQKGILLLYPFFHRHGFFWAAGYHTRPDPMHFELADETVRALAA